MKKTMTALLLSLALALTPALGIAAESGGRIPDGTYVHAKGKGSMTFSGNTLTQVAYGMKVVSTYTIENGRIVWKNLSGNVNKTPFKLEGNTLTWDEGKYAEEFTKK